jgi:hypothetical protein
MVCVLFLTLKPSNMRVNTEQEEEINRDTHPALPSPLLPLLDSGAVRKLHKKFQAFVCVIKNEQSSMFL